MQRSFYWTVALVSLFIGLVCGFLANDRLIGQPAAPAVVMPKELTSFAPVVKRVLPAVVSIEGKTKNPPTGVGRQTQFSPTAAPPNQPAPENDPGFGSGVIVDPAGVILTNHHVVADTDSVDITFHDGRKIVSRDIRRDPKTDLAIIKFQPEGAVASLEFGDSDALEVGDRVLAVGAPFGLTGSVTHGIVSAKSRNNLKLNQYEDFIQTDAAINPGNSGGPLVNLEGRVVGITSAIKTKSGGFQGVGLAVSSNLARFVVRELLTNGVVRRGHIGVEIRDGAGGVSVSKVTPGSPAAKAAVQPGDVITGLAGKPIKDSRDLQRIVATLTLGEATEIAVVRGGRARNLPITIEGEAGAVDAPAKDALAVPDYGLTFLDLTPALAGRLKLPAGAKGVYISRVDPKSPAAIAGLVEGTLLLSVDRTPVATAKAAREAMVAADRAKGALVEVLNANGETKFAIVAVP